MAVGSAIPSRKGYPPRFTTAPPFATPLSPPLFSSSTATRSVFSSPTHVPVFLQSADLRNRLGTVSQQSLAKSRQVCLCTKKKFLLNIMYICTRHGLETRRSPAPVQ
ncbi:hypothetical protein RSOLAG1IB_06698 [Rhizoctonia solani AG-1 IB]|uniref:Uncharacterized protein n=1 Tax=Thanatephorus cucumeris (strain AG1-IB / isolate 7/3/14) TaxID=1108050 RepID=A0A0B7F774_THACB|nr:hypothetical protein RSOLAG1IB_06698 [Rhizoctonia solani AG-1 IB]